jgi:hypothetical protein
VSLGVFLSGFVINEPAPYELYMAGLIAVWALFGLRISRSIAPLLVLLVLFNIGGMISMTQMADLMDTPLYLAVSLFLAFTASSSPPSPRRGRQSVPPIFLAWILAAVSTATLGILGYFGMPARRGDVHQIRARRRRLQDPNVFGPFLTLPGHLPALQADDRAARANDARLRRCLC